MTNAKISCLQKEPVLNLEPKKDNKQNGEQK